MDKHDAALRFHKSSYSTATQNDCLEVAPTPTGHLTRDSKAPTHGTQHHSHTAWAVFLNSLKSDAR